jgi:tungstate transport system ATP-binding protein
MINARKGDWQSGRALWNTHSGKVQLSGIRQIRQGRTILDIPDLKLLPGRRYALLGANGSGKSTLLQLLADHLTSPDGEIGYLPQKPHAFALSVRHNIGLGIPQQLYPGQQLRNDLIDRQLEAMDLQGLHAARGSRMSGGEAQRMALARLLVVPRKILLLDEPTAALDLDSLTRIEEILCRYLAAHDSLLVLATHQVSLARRLCDELIFLDQGQVHTSGSLTTCLNALDRPGDQNERLRLFLGYAKSDARSDPGSALDKRTEAMSC